MLKFLSSNKFKINEYRALGLDFQVEAGPDLPEVVADPITIVKYKSLLSGKDTIVEDSILTIDGEEVIDIRWRINELALIDSSPDIRWVVTIGHNDGANINIYQAESKCTHVKGITPESVPEDAIAFDPYLSPEGTDKSFYELMKDGTRKEYSPRTFVMCKFLKFSPDIVFPISDIKEWDGEYQTD